MTANFLPISQAVKAVDFDSTIVGSIPTWATIIITERGDYLL